MGVLACPPGALGDPQPAICREPEDADPTVAEPPVAGDLQDFLPQGLALVLQSGPDSRRRLVRFPQVQVLLMAETGIGDHHRGGRAKTDRVRDRAHPLPHRTQGLAFPGSPGKTS